MLNSIQSTIGLCFKSSDLGEASWILGICIQHNIATGTLFIDQAQYIKNILSQYGMDDCHPVSTPLPPCTQFQPASAEEHASISSYPYLKAIGSLTYATMGTHPDICATVRSLSPFTATFSPDHINGVKHIMRYLAGCPSCGIMYTMGESEIVGYTNVDWANDCLNHCSIS